MEEDTWGMIIWAIIVICLITFGIWWGIYQYHLCLDEGMSKLYCLQHAFG